MDRILTIIGFGAEKYTGFLGFKKRNVSIRYSGTETNAGDRKDDSSKTLDSIRKAVLL